MKRLFKWQVGQLGTVQRELGMAKLKVDEGYVLLCRRYDATQAAMLILERDASATVCLLDLNAFEPLGIHINEFLEGVHCMT